MLSKKKQRKYLAQKGQRWLDELVAFDESHDEESLHKLRLEIKKIRALVRLFENVRGKRLAKDFRPLKKVFKQAGVIRDTRSEVNLLEARQLLSPEFKDRRLHQIQAATDNFARHFPDYRKKGKKAARQLLADVHSIRSMKIRRWIAEEMIQVGILLTKTGDDLHMARKKIKTLLYVEKILPKGLADQLCLNRDYLDRLQDAIGKWHDDLVAAADLHHENADGEKLMRQECREKEQAIRVLAGDFWRTAHRQPCPRG
ncbi:MAG TPA: CHAD domain-containing protein [Puia sp.]|jgi:CHAD domain-containing protein|nr:CHAD domain-containing protein [Puia sp.]